MKDRTPFNDGWDFMSSHIGADIVARGAVSDFIAVAQQNQQIVLENARRIAINEAIDQLTRSVNEHPYINLGVEQFKGYVAEEIVAGTFNIEAIRQGSEHRAYSFPNESGYGSIDIDTNFGKTYSLKFTNEAARAEAFQAVVDTETSLPKYHGQERLIADDQLDEARYWARRRAATEAGKRPSVAEAHRETGEHLISTVSDGEGVSSRKLTSDEARNAAKHAKKGSFEAEELGYSKEALLDEVRLNYIKKAAKAGLTAATLTAILQLVPELYKAIDYLIKNGELDVNQLKKSGVKVLSASGESFLRGSIAYLAQMAIQEGLLGEKMKQVDPILVGVAVTVILGTIKNSILVALGKMTVAQMGMQFIDTIVVSSGYLVSMKIGGAIAQAFFPQLPGIGFAIGSLLGCSLALVYNVAKNKLISFCVDTGFTCFGLVEQSYELPEEVLKKLGIDLIPIKRTEISRTQISRPQITTTVDTVQYETIDIQVLRRGVIGVNKVGFVF
ncbi:MAG: hypothetical protein IJB34_01325 [Clostridia bacterium]|nr:hypothetical protein [Clostridia bacterium]